MTFSSRLSEALLVVLLVLLVACMRIYVGGPDGIIWVWKGAPSFNDTVVELKNFQAMPREELKKSHYDVLWQLEDMGFIENLEHAKLRQHKRH